MYFVSFSLHPLFPGSNEVDQIAKIHDIMGTPDSSVLDKLKKWVPFVAVKFIHSFTQYFNPHYWHVTSDYWCTKVKFLPISFLSNLPT